MPVDERDEMLREMARHRGFRLVKSRRRKPGAGDYGRYGLADPRTGKECYGFGSHGLEATAEEIERFLRGRAQAEWKSSLTAQVERTPAVARTRAGREPRERRERAPPPPRPPRRPGSGPKPALELAEAAPPRAKAEPPATRVRLEIRVAAPRDVDAIARLLADMGEQQDGKSLRKTIAALSKQGSPLLVAEQEEVVGCAGWQIMLIPQYSVPVGRITLLVTAKSARRRGIGTALLRAVEARLKAKKCRRIELVHDIELSSANSFLRECGYKRSGYRFARELSEGETINIDRD